MSQAERRPFFSDLLAVPVLTQSRRSSPFIVEAFADLDYTGDRTADATLITVQIVRKPPGQARFMVQLWIVEHFFAWISRNRRL